MGEDHGSNRDAAARGADRKGSPPADLPPGLPPENPITFPDVAPAIEFACWVVLALAPFLRWVNGAAVGDRAAQVSRLADRFGSRVEDHLVDNGHRAHDPEPYLNNKATGAAIAAALA